MDVERPRRLGIQDYAPRFKGGFDLSKDREFAPDPSALARTLKRVMLTITEPLTDAELVSEIGIRSVQRRQGMVHLTNRQTAAHRRRSLAALRDDLKAVRSCRVTAYIPGRGRC